MEELIMDVTHVNVVRKVHKIEDNELDYYEVTLRTDEESALKINRIKSSVVNEALGGTKCRFGGVNVKFNMSKENLRSH